MIRSRNFDFRIRGVDRSARSATFVAATETPVPIGGGGWEVLRMGGAKLTRFAKNPVFLDTHNRDSVSCVLGKVEARVEGLELIARVEYATHERAQVAWDLVDGGFVRAVSVGYLPLVERELRKGETDGDLVGPGVIVLEWDLFELSQCSVPADENALVRRAAGDGPAVDPARCLRQVSSADLARAFSFENDMRVAKDEPVPEAPEPKAPDPALDDFARAFGFGGGVEE